MDEQNNKVSFTLRPEEFTTAYRLARRRSPRTIFVNIVVWVAGAVAVVMILHGIWNAHLSNAMRTYVAVAINLLAAIFVYGYIALLAWVLMFAIVVRPRKLRKIYRQQVDLHLEQTLSWSNEGLCW
jgi:hypothetical protein